MKESVTKKTSNPKKIIARGLLLPKDKISRNGILYDWDTIKQNYEKLKGLPMLYNHLNEGSDKPIGHFTNTWLKEVDDENGVAGWYYEANINPKSEYADSILRGDIRKVSVQVIAPDQKNEKTDDGQGYTRAFIQDVLESSAVPTPGFMETNMAIMAEKVKKKNTLCIESVNCELTSGDIPIQKMLKKKDGTGPNPDCPLKKDEAIEGDSYGTFPMEQFHVGLMTEIKEHPDVDDIESAQLVLDHLKEDPAYYNKEEGCSKDELEELINIFPTEKFKIVDMLTILTDDDVDEVNNYF